MSGCSAARRLRYARGFHHQPMLTALPASGFVAVIVALLPGVVRFWRGRPLARSIDDPALPERLVANNRRNRQVTAACCAVLLVGWPRWANWTLPLVIVTRLVAAYPLRKLLYGETWGLGAYLAFYARMLVALF